MAEASYTSKIKYSIEDLMSSLVACKTQAEQVDGVLANIGKRGNLNNFIKQFVAMDDAVKALRKDLDSVKAGLGDKLNSGYMKSFDKMVEQMSQISELSKNVFTGLSGVNLKDKGATKELLSYAEQLNTILKNVGIDKQIDLDLFNTKSVEEQFNALIQYASELNGKLNVAFGEIDLSKVGDNIKSAGDETVNNIKEAGNKISEEVQRQIDELEKQKATYQEALDIFSGKGSKIKTTKKNDVAILTNLVDEFKKAELELSNKKQGSSGYEEAFAKKIKAATLLKNTADYVSGDDGSVKGQTYVANISKEYDRAERFLKNFSENQKAILEKIKNEYKQKIADINSEIDNLKSIGNKDDFAEKENVASEEKKISLYDELNKKVKEYVSLLSSADREKMDDEILFALVDEIKEVSRASKEAGTAIEQVFADLDFGDITGDEALSKICELLNVEIPMAAQKSAKEVGGVTGELQELLNLASRQEVGYSKGSGDAKESMTLFGTDKVVSSFAGKDFQVDTDAIVSQLVNNLKENIVMSLHNHPDGMSAFTPSDINSFTKLFYDQGTKINGIIADGVVKTIDFTGISKEMAIKIGESYSQNLKAATKEFPLMEYNDGEVGLIKGAEEKAAQAGISYEQLIAAFNEKINQALDKAFTDNGLASTVKTYTMEQLPELSSYLAEIQKNGENSVAPIEKLKSLLATLNPSHTADWDKFKDIFSSFESGEIDSTNAWNQSVARIKEIEAQAAEAHKKTTEAINEETSAQEKLNQIQSGQPSIQSNQTDNQTAQLEKEKELMQEIAALKEKLNAIPTNPVDAAELDAAQKQVQALEEEILRMEGALESWKSGYYGIQDTLDRSVDASELNNMTPNDVVDEYKAQIESLSSIIDELKTKLADTKAQLGSATEAKQKGTEAAEQELAVEKQQNEEAKQQLATQQRITKEKEKQTQSDASKVSKVETGKVASGQSTGEPVATTPEVTSAGGVQESFAAATEQKNQFIDANAKVKESAEASAVAIEKEIEKAREVSEAFTSATQAKNDFVNANQNVKDSADKTVGSLENETAASKGTRKRKTSRSSSSESSNEGYKELDNYKTLIDANQKLSSAFRKIDTEVFVDKDSDLGQLKSRYEALSKEIQELTKSEEAFGKVSEDDMQRLSAATKQLMSDFEQYAKVKKDSAKQSNTSYGADVVGQVEAKHTGLINNVNSKGYANASGLTTQLQQYEQAYQRIITLQKELANVDITSDVGKKKAAEFDSAVESFNKYGKAIENIIKKSEEMKNKVGNITRAVSDGFDIGDEASRRSELEAFANSFDGLDQKSIQFADNYSKVTFTIKNGNGEIEKLTASFNQAGNAINASSKNIGKAGSIFGSFFSDVKKKSGEILTYFTGANLVYKTVAQIKQGITYVREIDAALTELKKVTDETDETYAKFLKTMSQTGAEVGATVTNLINSSADWARLGYSIQEAGELAKNTAVLMNVSEFDNVADATDSMISALKAFNYQAEDSLHLVDIFNAIGNNFAISTSDLASSLTKSASALVTAGVGIEQASALLTGANTIMQDPDSVSQGLKIIALRIRGVKTELEEMGEETDNVLNTAKLQEKIKGLTGVDIIDEAGGFRNIYDILMDIADVWDELDSMSQAAVVEAMAGKNRANVFTSLMVQADTIKEAYDVAMDSEGSAMAENEKYLNSIQGKVDQFTNALQTMWSNFIDSSVIKFIVDVGTGLVQLADDLGIVGTAITAVVAKLALTKGFSELKNTINDVKTAFSTAMNVAKGAVSTISSFSGEGLSNFLGGKIEASSITAITQAINAEIAAQGSLNKELARQILLNNGVKEENIEGALAAMGYTSANGALTFSFKALGSAIWQAGKAFLASPFGKFALIAVGIGLVVAGLDAIIVTHDEYVDKLKETSDEISDVRSDIKSLNSELETTQERINELNSKDKLSFTEKEELKNLKAQNAELERSIELDKKKEKSLQKKAAKQLDNGVKTDSALQAGAFNSTNGPGAAASAAETGAYYQSNAFAFNGIDDQIVRYQKAKEALDNAEKEFADLGDDATESQISKAQKKVEQQKTALESAETAITDTMKKLDDDYLSQEGVEWQYGDPDELEDWQKQMNANLKIIYDAQDKLAIASDTTGKAIESAFSRVSLQTEFEDELKTIQETAGITGESLKDMLSFNEDGTLDTSANGMSAFAQALMDCGVIADTSAAELQKVVDLAVELGDNTSEAAVANQKLARSQKRLQYYKQYKELNKYVKSVINAEKHASSFTEAQIKGFSAMASSTSQSLQALAKEIDAYDILGAQIEEAKQAFEDFEKAKESDENTDYASTAGEMLQTVIEGFQSAEMGTEAFKSAFTGLIPESVYKDLDTLEEKYTAAAEYISEDLSKYFTIKYDDEGALESVEVTTKNVETFMEEAQSKGLATFENGRWTILETNFKKFASEMGITTSALVAFGEQADKIDADWIMGDYSSFFDIFDMDTESNIDKITRSLANLDLQLLNGQIDVNDYAQEYAKLQDELASEKANAVSDIIEYDNTTKEIDSLKTQLQEATNKLNELKTSGASEDQITDAANEAGEIAKNLQDAIKKKADLCQPSEMLVEVALEDIQATKDRITAELGTIDANLQLTTTDKDGNEQINSSIIQQLDDGTYTINVDANLSEEAKAKVQEYVDALNSEVQINQYVTGTQDATTDAENLKQTYNDLSEVIENLPDVSISTVAAQTAVNTLKTRVDKLKTAIEDLPKDVTITTTNVNRTVTDGAGGGGASGAFSLNGNAHFDGAANASGTLGAEKTETSLVGELGPEMRVRGNRWELIGENGAEFTDVKKGDIIFNHKQTEQLMKNGYVNGRGKAYANGTNNTFASRGSSIDYEKCIKLLDQYEKDVAQATKESNDYISKLDDRYKKYGNIDNVDRNIVLWNDENLNKYSAYIESMANLYDMSAKDFADDLAGSWSTVLGAADRFEFNGQSMEVAYSQMLNDGADTKLLTYEELENYMYDLMQRSMVNGSVDPNKMVELDSNGIVEDIQGEMVLVKDLLAGVEGQLVDGIKLSKEDIQTMAGDLTNSSSIYSGYSMHDIQENTLWKDAVANYGMGGSAFVELEAEAESYGLTLDELIAKTEAYRETTQTPLQQDVNVGATIDAEGIAQKIYSVFSNIFSTISSWFSNLFSGGDSGNEEDGASHAFGSDGLKTSEHNALVGELGEETVVNPNTGEYYTVGARGAELVDLPKDAIIFNHEQTKALFKNGYITSRGKSLARGNAHAGVSGTIFTKYATVSGYGGTVPDWFGHSSILGDISSAADATSDAAGDVSDAADDAEQTIDFIEYRLDEIENSITNMTDRIENFLDDTSQTNEKNSLYEGLIDAEKQKASTYLHAAELYNKKAAELLSEVPAEYQEMAKNGAIAIKDFIGESEGEIADAIEEYRTWSTKAEDAENSYLESIAEISAKRLEQLNDIADDFENIVGLVEQHSNLIQAEMDLLDEAGERLSENFYQELMKDSQKQIEDLNNKRASLQNILDQAVASGDVRVGTDDWYEMVNAIYDVDDSILSCKKDLESFQNSINDLYWDNLDKLIDKIDNVDSELSHLYNLVSDEEKVVDEFGNWTKDGVTALGLLAQQLEAANFKVEQYGEAIARLEKDYAAGLYSTDEYNEKLAELKENQWDAIEAQESAKKSIIDLNKTRIESVKTSIQAEIDSLSKLIDKKKEELQLQKD